MRHGELLTRHHRKCPGRHRGTVDCGIWGRPRRINGGADRRLRSDHRVDRLPSRLALARELGATHTLESRGAETLAEIRRITGGGTDFALEASAVSAVFRLAVDGLRGLGTCILVGSARAGPEVSFEMPWLRGGRIVRVVIPGDGRPRDFIPRLVDLFMAGRMPLDRLITRHDFADINRAAANATSGAAFQSASVDRDRRPSVAPCRK